jgi:type I restriction enzyme S subunit
MKQAWEHLKLGELCEFLDRRGVTPEKLGSQFLDAGFRVVSARNIKGRRLVLDAGEQRFVDEPTYRRWMQSPLHADDVLLTSEAPLGEPAYIDDDLELCLGQRLFGIRTDKRRLFGRFLFLALQSGDVRKDLLSRASGATAQGIRQSELRHVVIPVPPLPEQQRIVALLDEAFAGLATAKANAERNLQNARALFESHLNAAFSQRGEGWVEKTLEEIGRTQTGSTPKTSDHSNYGDFISFVKPGDFKPDGTLDYGNDGLSKTGADGARIVPADSVLMVCIGATIGKCGYSDRAVTTNQQVNALTPSDGSSNRFIYYQMLTESFQRSVIHASGQATLPIINKSKWSSLPVWLPPTAAEQEAIAEEFDALVDETQRLTRLYERKLVALEELKKSLLHQAFNGEL